MLPLEKYLKQPSCSPKCATLPRECGAALAPTERHGARAVGAFLHEGLVELAARPGVDRRPAVLAVILQPDGHWW